MVYVDLNVSNFEPVEGRYDREWLELEDDRKVRGYDERSAERRSRDFVDPEDFNETTVDYDVVNGSETFGGVGIVVDGTVGDKHDNVPDGFDVAAYEETLEYLPDRDDS